MPFHCSALPLICMCVWLPQRFLLWQMRNDIVEPFGETVQQVYARISALRNNLGGLAVRAHPAWSAQLLSRGPSVQWLACKLKVVAWHACSWTTRASSMPTLASSPFQTLSSTSSPQACVLAKPFPATPLRRAIALFV